MYQHPVLVEAVIRHRVAELRHIADGTGRVHAAKRRHELLDSARHGTGWLLVDLGLKLATPRRLSRPVVRGQR